MDREELAQRILFLTDARCIHLREIDRLCDEILSGKTEKEVKDGKIQDKRR